jgi:hypothetical protein
MDIAALSIGVFGAISLTVAFAKCTIAKRKAMKFENHTKNHMRRF